MFWAVGAVNRGQISGSFSFSSVFKSIDVPLDSGMKKKGLKMGMLWDL